jgi:hypothetical protein
MHFNVVIDISVLMCYIIFLVLALIMYLMMARNYSRNM